MTRTVCLAHKKWTWIGPCKHCPRKTRYNLSYCVRVTTKVWHSAPCSPGPKPSLSTPVLQHPPLAPAVPGLTHSVPDSDNLSTLKPLFLCIGWCVCVCVCSFFTWSTFFCVCLCAVCTCCGRFSCHWMWLDRFAREASGKLPERETDQLFLGTGGQLFVHCLSFSPLWYTQQNTHSCYYVWTNIAHKILS